MSLIKRIVTYPVRVVDDLGEKVAATAGAVGLSQAPSFMNNYAQRLGGHVDRAGKIVGEYASSAAGCGKTLEQYINTHLNSGTYEFMSSGKVMRGAVESLDSLKHGLEALLSASAWEKPFVFLNNIDWDIAMSTLKNYTMSVPVDPTGLAYAVGGIVLGTLAYKGAKYAAKKCYGMIKNMVSSKKEYAAKAA